MFDKKEYMKQWRKDNKKHRNEYQKKWYANYKEENNENYKQYQNPEQHKKWKESHKEHIEKYNREWRGNNRGYKKEWVKDNPEKMKIFSKKCNYKRRNLGFNPLNKYFEGSEAHHINNNDVIYILKELHRSIPHCLESGRNMGKINILTMDNIR